MSNDSGNGGDQGKRGKRTDLAKLGEQMKALGQTGGALKKAMENMDRQMRPFRDMQEKMERQMRPFRDLEDRMKSLGLHAGENSALGRVSKQIADQQRAINAMPQIQPQVPHIPEISIPRNPIHETNERLKRIEDRFEQMQVIATDAAQIATGLQAAAAEFLQKFEKAATDNDRTAGRAIRIGLVAVFIAVAMPAAQIIYSEYRRQPDNSPAIEATLESIQSELAATREFQGDLADRIDKAITSSDTENAAVLRDIHALLSRQIGSPPKGGAQ